MPGIPAHVLEAQEELLSLLRTRPIAAREVAELYHLDHSQAYRRLQALERQHGRITSQLEAGPSGVGQRRVWRWS